MSDASGSAPDEEQAPRLRNLLSECPARRSALQLVDPYPLPDDHLAPLCDFVPGVGSRAIRARTTGDVVLAPIYSTYIVVATLAVSCVPATTKAQRVGAAPSFDTVSATVPVVA